MILGAVLDQADHQARVLDIRVKDFPAASTLSALSSGIDFDDVMPLHHINTIKGGLHAHDA